MAQTAPITPISPAPEVANEPCVSEDRNTSQDDAEAGLKQDETSEQHTGVTGAAVEHPAASYDSQDQPPTVVAADDAQDPNTPTGGDEQAIDTAPIDAATEQPASDDVLPKTPSQGDTVENPPNADTLTQGNDASPPPWQDPPQYHPTDTEAEDDENADVPIDGHDADEPNDQDAPPPSENSEGNIGQNIDGVFVPGETRDGRFSPGVRRNGIWYSSNPPPVDRGPWPTIPPFVHNGRFYAVTNTEYQDTNWRYDVLSTRHIIRVSTIPDDFIGASAENNWTMELHAAWRHYKAYGLLHEALNYLEYDPDAHRVGTLFYLKLKRLSAFRTGQARVRFLKKWPNAFQLAQNNAGHWHAPRVDFTRAEAKRRQAHAVATTPLAPGQVDQSGDFRSHIRTETERNLVLPTYHVHLGDHALSIAAQARDVLRSLLISVDDSEEGDPETWTTVRINADDQIGQHVYAVSPKQYEDMRVHNEKAKTALIAAINDPARAVTLANAGTVARPRYPPLKPGLWWRRGGDSVPDRMSCGYSLFQLDPHKNDELPSDDNLPRKDDDEVARADAAEAAAAAIVAEVSRAARFAVAAAGAIAILLVVATGIVDGPAWSVVAMLVVAATAEVVARAGAATAAILIAAGAAAAAGAGAAALGEPGPVRVAGVATATATAYPARASRLASARLGALAVLAAMGYTTANGAVEVGAAVEAAARARAAAAAAAAAAENDDLPAGHTVVLPGANNAAPPGAPPPPPEAPQGAPPGATGPADPTADGATGPADAAADGATNATANAAGTTDGAAAAAADTVENPANPGVADGADADADADANADADADGPAATAGEDIGGEAAQPGSGW